MARISRTFEAPEAPPLDEWVEFTLTGSWSDAATAAQQGERWTETFVCSPILTVGAATAFLSVKGVDDFGNREYKTPSMYRLFAMILRPADFARLQRLWEDPLRVMTPAYVGQVVEWLVEVMLGRPTGPRLASSGGLAVAGTGSEDGSPSPESTSTTTATPAA